MPRIFIGSVGVFGVAAALIFVSHFTLITNPNSFYLGDSNDGFKNYYTLIYHIKHDSTYSHFEGMNYPYGEHIVFTDNQPLLSNTIKFISRNFVDISDYTVGIMNILMLLSIVITCLIVYLIFRRYEIPDLWAIPFAVGIGFMAPQIHRMGGHYALAYGFIIPLCILLWLRFYHNSSLRNSMLLGALVLLSSLLHMYYFAINAFFLTFYFGLTFFKNVSGKQMMFVGKNLFIQVFLPFFLIRFWFFLTDSVEDRPTSPYGFLDYRARWQGIFLPISYPIGNFIHSIKPIRQIEWEAIAYTGLIPGFFFARYLLLAAVKFAKSKGKQIIGITNNADLNMLFLTSILVLLFSFGFPFIFKLQFLVEYLGPLKQFRSIARFSWVFYFGMNIVAFITLYRVATERLQPARISKLVLTLGVILLAYEAHLFQKVRPFYNLGTTHELESTSSASYKMSPILNIDASQYQAILPLPYFHSGSENISRAEKGEIGRNTMVASIVSGLPIIGSIMSRTSLSQTINNLKLVLEPYGPFEVFDDYPNAKPMLLWIERGVPLSSDERRLVEQAMVLDFNAQAVLAKLSIQDFYDVLNERYSSNRAEVGDTTLHQVGGFLTRDSVPNFYHEYEIDQDGKIEHRHSRISQGNVHDKNVIYNATLPMQDSVSYILSLWVKFCEDLDPTARLYFDELNEDGNIIFAESWSFGELVKLIDYDRALIEYKFKPRGKNTVLRFTITNEHIEDITVSWNDLLIRPEGNDIYYLRDGNIVFKNGRTYGPEFFLRTGEAIEQNVY